MISLCCKTLHSAKFLRSFSLVTVHLYLKVILFLQLMSLYSPEMGRVYCFMNKASTLLFPFNIAKLLLANFIGLNPCQGFVRVLSGFC